MKSERDQRKHNYDRLDVKEILALRKDDSSAVAIAAVVLLLQKLQGGPKVTPHQILCG